MGLKRCTSQQSALNDICLESLAFHNLGACDRWLPQPIEMLTLRTIVGGLQMTNDKLEWYIDELLAENDEIKEQTASHQPATPPQNLPWSQQQRAVSEL